MRALICALVILAACAGDALAGGWKVYQSSLSDNTNIASPWVDCTESNEVIISYAFDPNDAATGYVRMYVEASFDRVNYEIISLYELGVSSDRSYRIVAAKLAVPLWQGNQPGSTMTPGSPAPYIRISMSNLTGASMAKIGMAIMLQSK